MKTPLTLIIMDGYGLGNAGSDNAVRAAFSPNLEKIFKEHPTTELQCSGVQVGLPDGQMGNSEVGHTNIGAGRIVYQDLLRISNSVSDGSFFKNPALVSAVESCKKNNTALHLMGLLSDGGVHSHVSHVWALLKLAKEHGLSKVFIHCFLDGRDTPPMSGLGYIRECIAKTEELGVGRIATVMGRYYAMDRDHRYERVEKAYAAMVYGEGVQNPDPVKAMEITYAAGTTDEFVVPVVCAEGAQVSAGDSVIFFNFRPDRAREITRTLVDPEFTGFKRNKGFFPLHFVCMTSYEADMPNVAVAFEEKKITNTLGEYISKLGRSQLRIAETEKYAHVTFFFNGGMEEPYPGESRILIPSPKVATYDLKPEMSAYEVTDAVCEQIEKGKFDLIILNFANCDMVGHTGVFEAAKKAVETVDICVGRVVETMETMGGITLITADHGNAENMLDADGQTPFTAHTTNPVPFSIVGADVHLNKGRLCDIAPTILDLMGLEKPAEMTGQSLIQ